MTDEQLIFLTNMLMYGTQTEKNYASRKLDEWFVNEIQIACNAEKEREAKTTC